MMTTTVAEENRTRQLFDQQAWNALNGLPKQVSDGLHALLDNISLKPSPKIAWTGEATYQSRLSLKAKSLHAFMCMEVAAAAAAEAALGRCENCENRILTGPATGRRSSSKYCSDRCRVAAMRKRQAAS
ncbi:hypothetical protein [Mesorhizobium wenxiniae]|nr:hypothetical protein [Mesorhizobium wenxiniae]